MHQGTWRVTAYQRAKASIPAAAACQTLPIYICHVSTHAVAIAWHFTSRRLRSRRICRDSVKALIDVHEHFTTPLEAEESAHLE